MGNLKNTKINEEILLPVLLEMRVVISNHPTYAILRFEMFFFFLAKISKNHLENIGIF